MMPPQLKRIKVDYAIQLNDMGGIVLTQPSHGSCEIVADFTCCTEGLIAAK